MSFEARNLRIQLPCRQVTILDCGVGVTHLCGHPTVLCQFPTNQCWPHISCGLLGSCGPLSPCHYNTWVTCEFGTHGGCGVISPVVQDPGTIVIDPEQIAVLRKRLEAQLKELDEAETKLREFREKGSG